MIVTNSFNISIKSNFPVSLQLSIIIRKMQIIDIFLSVMYLVLLESAQMLINIFDQGVALFKDVKGLWYLVRRNFDKKFRPIKVSLVEVQVNLRG